MNSVACFSDTYRKFIASPSVSSAKVLSSNIIEVLYSQSALSIEKNIKIISNFISCNESSNYSQIGFTVPQSEDIKAREYSPSRKYLAIIKKQEKESKDIIEVCKLNIN